MLSCYKMTVEQYSSFFIALIFYREAKLLIYRCRFDSIHTYILYLVSQVYNSRMRITVKFIAE